MSYSNTNISFCMIYIENNFSPVLLWYRGKLADLWYNTPTMAGSTQEALKIIPPLDPDDDQTFGYLADGEPVTADWPTTVWPIPNMLKPGAIKANVEFTGHIRHKTVGEPRHLAKEPRRAELVLGLDDDRGDISMHSVRRSRFPQAASQLPLSQAREVMGFSHEKRRLTTALKKTHTRAHWPTQMDAGDPNGVRKLGLGGFYSPVERVVYRFQRDRIQEQEQQKNAPKPPVTDDIPF